MPWPVGAVEFDEAAAMAKPAKSDMAAKSEMTRGQTGLANKGPKMPGSSVRRPGC
jgi:hypothetical protein